MEFRVGDTFIVEIVSIDHMNRGVAVRDGKNIIVPETGAGQKVKVRIVKARQASYLAEVIEQIE